MWAFQTFFINDLNSHVLQEFLTTLQTIRIAANQSIIECQSMTLLDIKKNQISICSKFNNKIQNVWRHIGWCSPKKM